MRIRIPVSVVFLLISYLLAAQKLIPSDYAAYIKTHQSLAIREMKLFKIPASITLAQGILESGCGKSPLAVSTMNHFGVKCQKEWTGETFFYDDDHANECFRKYNNVEESYRDHSLFLTTRVRYAQLFTLPLTDYKGWALGLKQAGYATNPQYASILIELIEKNKLYLLDDTLKFNREDEAINGAMGEAIRKDLPASGKNQSTTSEGRLLFRKNYRMPVPSGFETVYVSEMGRKVYENCNVPFIFAKKGDTWYSIAKEFGVFSFQIYKQNDLLEDDPVTDGQMLYLEQKNKKNISKVHKVQHGESLYSISQEKCIRLPFLLKYNNLKPGDEPNVGFELKLTK